MWIKVMDGGIDRYYNLDNIVTFEDSSPIRLHYDCVNGTRDSIYFTDETSKRLFLKEVIDAGRPITQSSFDGLGGEPGLQSTSIPIRSEEMHKTDGVPLVTERKKIATRKSKDGVRRLRISRGTNKRLDKKNGI